MITVRDLSLRQGTFSLEKILLFRANGPNTRTDGQDGLRQDEHSRSDRGLRPSNGIDSFGRPGSLQAAASRTRHRLCAPGRRVVPTMTVREHLAFALMLRVAPAAEIERRVVELADCWTSPRSCIAIPAGLSGGKPSRVAVGRALSFRPRYLLMMSRSVRSMKPPADNWLAC